MKLKALADWHTISGRPECCKTREHDICFDLCGNECTRSCALAKGRQLHVSMLFI